MQVDMKNILPGCLPVRQEEIDPFASYLTFTDRLRCELGCLEKATADIWVEF
jgi:hypothetical protein